MDQDGLRELRRDIFGNYSFIVILIWLLSVRDLTYSGSGVINGVKSFRAYKGSGGLSPQIHFHDDMTLYDPVKEPGTQATNYL